MIRTLASILAVSFSAIVAMPGDSFAQSYPSGPVRIVVPYTPGGQGDVTARILVEPLSSALGSPVVVENRSGANGTIGTAHVANSTHDGQTLAMVVGSHVLTKALMPALPYDPIEDFVPVSLIARTDIVFVVPGDIPVETMQEFIEYAAARDGELAYASAGVGSNSHVFAEWFLRETQLDIIHIPYQGSGAAHADLMAGAVNFAFDTLPSVRGFIEQGHLKILAVAGADRSPDLPDIPTIAEAGYPDFDAGSWSALLAPAGTPDEIVQRINSELIEILDRPDIREQLASVGARVVATSPQEAATIMAEDTERYTAIIRDVGISLD